MTPFREPPKVSLGPLSVGLRRRLSRVMARLPSGGRILEEGAPRKAPHTRGAIGCTGFTLAVAAAFVALTTGWLPRTHAGVFLVIAVVIGAGACLAAVISTLDRARTLPTREGQAVGRAAKRVMKRIARLAARAADERSSFGPRHITSLRRALAAASDPSLASWIDEDVRGRVELLLARALAKEAGARLPRDAVMVADVRAMLVRASEHLEDPSAALVDLAALDASLWRTSRRRIKAPSSLDLSPAIMLEDEARLVEEALAEDDLALRPEARRLGVIP